jgi:hypothetical protein
MNQKYVINSVIHHYKPDIRRLYGISLSIAAFVYVILCYLESNKNTLAVILSLS